jgi:ATP-binding cassette, subfamily B (MDR/TAP), member 1
MTLMFGKFTTAFVAFGIATQNAFSEGATPAAFQALQAAAQDFRQTASNDALYLVFIGALTCL